MVTSSVAEGVCAYVAAAHDVTAAPPSQVDLSVSAGTNRLWLLGATVISANPFSYRGKKPLDRKSRTVPMKVNWSDSGIVLCGM